MKAILFTLLASCTTDITVFDRIDDVETARDLDILYVLDNSSDRARYDTMASQLDVLSTQLALVDGQVPNLHVGVVTSDMGIKGTEDAAPGATIRNCSGTGDNGKLQRFDAALDDAFLIDVRGENGTRIRNFDAEDDADLAAELALLTNPIGIKTGCEFAQPMEAMRRALDPANNPGFLRERAQLMVVFLTNEDDCSFKTSALFDPTNVTLGAESFRCTQQGVFCTDGEPSSPGVHDTCLPREDSAFVVPVGEYRTFLEGVKDDKRDVIVSAVAGPVAPFTTLSLGKPVLAPSCNGIDGSAKPAVRIASLVGSFGGALVESCTQDAAYDALTAPVLARQKS
ncbi:MAG: hypothetical protein H0V17_12165, partial [Deltaproteobacteria bacterium]|nr:hypothetical protein [Deltaproteobacteria bacterium]